MFANVIGNVRKTPDMPYEEEEDCPQWKNVTSPLPVQGYIPVKAAFLTSSPAFSPFGLPFSFIKPGKIVKRKHD